jgi:hypothetical protein
MAVTFDEYITIISLGISIVSIAVVIFLSYRWQSRLRVEHHNIESSPPVSDDSAVEVSAIVSEFSQRLRKLEESLVDQKVKMEILELRASRSPRETATAPYEYRRAETPLDNPERPSLEKIGLVSGVKISQKNERPDPDKRLGVTEIEALRLVFEGRGKMSAKEIQQRIGRTREHTARMMNSLYQDGLVERDITARPFSYSITQKGKDLLNG